MVDHTAEAKRARVLALLQLAADECCLDSTDHAAIVTYLDRTGDRADESTPSIAEQLDETHRAYARANETLQQQAALIEQQSREIESLTQERDTLAARTKKTKAHD
jgi:hypothetical protein